MLLGRDIRFVERVARETGLQVVACTGIYTYDRLPLFWQSRSADVMSDAFVHDIEQGIQGTDIKAAFLKCAADEPGVTESVEKVHRACARASVRTGVRSWPTQGRRRRPGRARSRSCSRRVSRPSRSRSPTRGHRRPRPHRAPARDGGVNRPRPRRDRDVAADRAPQRDTLALLERGYADRMFLSG